MLRFCDIVLSVLGLIILSPLLLLVAILISAGSRGGAIFRQERVGLAGHSFIMYKFRTMKPDTQNQALLTIDKDQRITKVGKTIRKYKIDEIPQLINVLKGEMSIVGPRPEVPRYVEKYTPEQQKILLVRPGITDMASICFYNEAKILSEQSDPEKYYEEVLIPRKIELNMRYIETQDLRYYFRIILKTILKTICSRSDQ